MMGAMVGMQFRALGPLVVRRDGQDLDLGPSKQRSLLALLLINADTFVSADRIFEEIWPEQAEGRKNTLHVQVSRLRSALEPGRKRGDPSILETRDESYRLTVDEQSYDVAIAERLVAEARLLLTSDPLTASRRLGEALAMWTGSAFEDFAFDSFAQPESVRLEELRIGAVEDRIEADLACGKAGELVSELEALREQHPLRERLVSHHALALYRAGRPADALRSIGRFRRYVGEELGIDPSPAIARLEEQILLHDASIQPRIAEDTDTNEAVRTDSPNPFMGLRAFGTDDASSFFGRGALVAELLRTLRSGQRLVALVGASGSGKSSAVRAGLIPALAKGAIEGSDRWLTATMVPGSNPFAELEAALLRSAINSPDSLSDQLDGSDGGLLRAAMRVLPSESDRIVIVIDQFEELFTMVDDPEVQRSFLASLVTAVDDSHHRVIVVLTLRADFYAYPLEHPEFGARLGPGVVNATALTSEELEAAAVRPAASAGVSFEPALLGELIADVGNQSSALPLFQYALTELFDRRAGDRLTAASYREMGRIQGALSRRATDVYESFDPQRQAVMRHLLLRLVTVGEHDEASRRRVQGGEIASLDVDAVDLHDVIAELGAHRLVSFDSDRLTGSPTIEVAHEALLDEWPTLSGWIDESRVDLRRQASLRVALDEWRLADHHADYLLETKRLDAFEDWRRTSTIALNSDEHAFLAASREAADVERLRQELEDENDRRAKRRLWGLVAGLAAGLALAGLFLFGIVGGSEPQGVAFFGNQEDDGGIDTNIANGLRRGERELDIALTEVPWAVDPVREFEEFVATQPDIVVTPALVGALGRQVIFDNPDVSFGIVDWEVDAPNATFITFVIEEQGFLAGAAAALRNDTGRVGLVMAAEVTFLAPFQAGFEAGVQSVDPDIEILRSLINEEGSEVGFFQPDIGQIRAAELYEQGVDVIVSAAGSSDFGTFTAAAEHTAATGTQVWAIGLDNDQWFAVPPNEQSAILTSIIKRVDVGAFRLIEHMTSGGPNGLVASLSVADDAYGVSTQGDDFTPEMSAALGEIMTEIAEGRVDLCQRPDGSGRPCPTRN